VTWSPDGQYLLYWAWGTSLEPQDFTSVDPAVCPGRAFLAAVPIDQDQVVVKLTDGGISDGRYDERSLVVPIQTWGIRASD
jgi:hypothetical protein